MDKTEANLMKNISALPPHWGVFYIDLESDPPYAMCGNPEFIGVEEKFIIPKPLAYFLFTHWAGTDKLRAQIKREFQNEIKQRYALLIEALYKVLPTTETDIV